MNAMSRVLKMTNRGHDIEVPVRVYWPIEDKTA
jgi:hypothetical protein